MSDWVARYLRYHSPEESEHDTLTEAIQRLSSGEEHCDLSAEAVVDPSGTVVLTGVELSDALHAAEDGKLGAWLAAWEQART